MAFYKYRAIDKNKKTKEGLVEAASKDFAVETLREQGLSIVSIIETSHRGKISLPILNQIKQKDIIIFSRQFSVMISANVAVVQSLKILVEQTANLKLKIIVSEIADEVDGGSKLSDAFAKRPKVFSAFYVSVVRSGETSGKLDEILNYLADEMEKDYDMMSKIKGAMIYPIFVLSSLLVVGTIMMIYVVPKLTDILTETGAELPLTTRILIGTSGFMAESWWIILILLGIFFIILRTYISKPVGRRQLDYIKLKLPIFGRLFQLIYLVRFTRSMQTLIVGGVTISKSLEVSSAVVDNEIYKQLIESTIKEVEEGNSISNVFLSSKEIPKMVSQMLAVGEKTGKIDVILERITDFYSREINNMVANLMTLMEPIIMVVMGVAVGIMVAAIILPMYNMAGQF